MVAQNPTFKSFYLLDCGPAISWLDSVTIRIWVNTTEGEKFKLLLDFEVALAALQFIGTQVSHISIFLNDFELKCHRWTPSGNPSPKTALFSRSQMVSILC